MRHDRCVLLATVLMALQAIPFALPFALPLACAQSSAPSDSTIPVTQNAARPSDEIQPVTARPEDAQDSYLYDLNQLIRQSKDNIKTVNEKIKEQAVMKRNQQREEKAREYYEQALKLREEGRLEEARILFDKAIQITNHPEMANYIKESARRAKLQSSALQQQLNDQQRRSQEEQRVLLERAETTYQDAVSLYKQQKFREAEEQFKLVEEMYPDYKAVRSYLQVVVQDITQADQTSAKEQKKEIERQQKEQEISRLREKEIWRKEIEKKESQRLAQVRQQAQTVYDEAVRLYQQRLFSEAREKFQEVEWVVPDFKSTRSYLARIDKDILDEKAQQAKRQREELDKQRWQEILNEKKAEVDRRKAEQLREQERQVQTREQAEFVYKAAVALFEKGEWGAAKDKFDEVQKIVPDYKGTRVYCRRIDEQLRQISLREEKSKMEQEQRRIFEEEAAKRKRDKEELQRLTAEADAFYEDALTLYKIGRLIEAKEKFLQVDQRVPDYRSCRSYLKRIDDDVSGLAKNQRLQRERVTRLGLEAKAETAYAAAVIAYDKQEFKAAKEKFLETEKIIPGYKKTSTYLRHIDQDIIRHEALQERARRADTMYAAAQKLYAAGDLAAARANFSALEAAWPGYKDTRARIAQIERDIRSKTTSQAPVPSAVPEALPPIAQIYKKAVASYKAKDYVLARQQFEEVRKIDPAYRSTGEYLKSIDAIQPSLPPAAVTTAVPPAPGSSMSASSQPLPKVVPEPRPQEVMRLIKSLSEGEKAATTSRTIAKVDRLINTLAEEQRRIARQVERQKQDEAKAARLAQQREKEEARAKAMRQAYEAKAEKEKARSQSQAEAEQRAALRSKEQEEARAQAREKEQQDQLKAETLYRQAMLLYRQKNYPEAQQRFNEVVAVIPVYKDAAQYLTRIERAQDETSLQQAEDKDRQTIQELADKANTINLEILDLTQKREYETVEKKFNDLQGILTQIQGIKITMVERRDQFEERWENRTRLRKGDSVKHPGKPFKKGEAGQTPRQKAVGLFREGQQLYAIQNFAEARAKFVDANAADPSYRPAMTYVQRIDRILASKDFETSHDKSKLRDLQARDDLRGDAPGAAAGQDGVSRPSIAPLTDLKRAATLSEDGIRLYKAKRYRESRIKFEELSQIGSPSDKRLASRYLEKINTALLREQAREEADRLARERRYLQERRSEDKLAWDRDKMEKQREKTTVRDAATARSNDDIRRQQTLIEIEKQNDRERRQKLAEQRPAETQAVDGKRDERGAFIDKGQQEKIIPAAALQAQEKAAAQKAQAASLEDCSRLQATDRQLAEETDPRTVSRASSRSVEQQRAQERREWQRLLAQEKAAADKEARQKSRDVTRRMKENRNKMPEDRDQEEIIRRNERAVRDILRSSPVPPAPSAAAATLDPLAQLQKRQLEEQRAAIRKDFETGVQRLYNNAVALYQRKVYDEARRDFLQVDSLMKGYKDTARYLTKIDRLTKPAKNAVPPAASRHAAPLPTPKVAPVAAKTPVVPAPSADKMKAVADALDTFDLNSQK